MEEGLKNYGLREFLEDCEEIFKVNMNLSKKCSYLEKKIIINFNKFYNKDRKSISISNYVTKVFDKNSKTRNNILVI
jgi:hypothetical protein